MKSSSNRGFRLTALLGLIVGVLAGCATPTSGNATVVALENPNNIAKVVQGAVNIGAGRFISKDPTYAGELAALADALIVVAKGNPSTLTPADIAATLANPKIKLSAATQAEFNNDLGLALDIFETDFSIQFPGLKPNYAIYLDAVANGLFASVSLPGSEVVLPVITWPPAAVPATTPVPASPASS